MTRRHMAVPIPEGSSVAMLQDIFACLPVDAVMYAVYYGVSTDQSVMILAHPDFPEVDANICTPKCVLEFENIRTFLGAYQMRIVGITHPTSKKTYKPE